LNATLDRLNGRVIPSTEPDSPQGQVQNTARTSKKGTLHHEQASVLTAIYKQVHKKSEYSGCYSGHLEKKESRTRYEQSYAAFAGSLLVA
jgi:hypothetical protein